LSGVGGRSGAGERVRPGFLVCSVAGVRVTVAAIAMVLAGGHRALLGHDTTCPPCRVRSAVCSGSSRCKFRGTVSVSNLLEARLRVHLCPRVPGRPSLELPEQCFMVDLRLTVRSGWVFLQGCLKTWLWRFDAVFVEPLLCER
jgi:hypothetical protein